MFYYTNIGKIWVIVCFSILNIVFMKDVIFINFNDARIILVNVVKIICINNCTTLQYVR